MMPENSEPGPPMDTETETFAETPPFRIARSAADTGGAYVRAEAIVRPLPGRSTPHAEHSHPRWFEEAGPTAHLHPIQEERIEVLSGEYRVRVGKTEHALKRGERIELPKNTPHAHWNPTDRAAHIAVEHRPATQSDTMFKALYQLAQDGKARRNGLPTPLQMATLSAACPDVVYVPWLPVPVQKSLNRLVAPIGRRLGYDVANSRDVTEQQG